ncbi:MAG: helix-turn-helix domain-containing protein [Lachnospiraceae bacterium]
MSGSKPCWPGSGSITEKKWQWRRSPGSAHVSRRECHRLFRKELGTTPAEYAASFRLQRARELLMKTDQSILDIAVETGFGTGSYFGKIFRKSQGMTPKKFRRLYRESAKNYLPDRFFGCR